MTTSTRRDLDHCLIDPGCNATLQGASSVRPVVVTTGAIVARIVEVWPHPNAHSLWVADIDPGSGWLRRVVHGGCRQLHPGDLVPYAPPGARLSTGKGMRARCYRGQRSDGMLCSSNELGWTTEGPDAVHVLGRIEDAGLGVAWRGQSRHVPAGQGMEKGRHDYAPALRLVPGYPLH